MMAARAKIEKKPTPACTGQTAGGMLQECSVPTLVCIIPESSASLHKMATRTKYKKACVAFTS